MTQGNIMKHFIAAAVLALATSSTASASSDITISNDRSSATGCVNVINPFTGSYLRQAEIDTSEMLDYLGRNGFKEVVKKVGPCQTWFTVEDERADIYFVYSTLDGEFVGFLGQMRDEGIQGFERAEKKEGCTMATRPAVESKPGSQSVCSVAS
jgi:hypothetical protein